MEVLPVRVTREENWEKAKGVIPNRNKAAKMPRQLTTRPFGRKTSSSRG